MTVFPVSGGLAGTLGAAPHSGAASADFETFLKMLTVQMQNQNPLNPMEASDFAVQLATFSGVEQQLRTNQLLEAGLAQAGLSEMSGMVGMSARVLAPAQFDGSPVRVAVGPVETAERTELFVTNSTGGVVDRVLLSPGQSELVWWGVAADGSAVPVGRYDFQLVGYAGGEVVGTRPAEIYLPVIEARRSGTDFTVLLHGGLEVPVGAIIALRRPEPW